MTTRTLVPAVIITAGTITSIVILAGFIAGTAR